MSEQEAIEAALDAACETLGAPWFGSRDALVLIEAAAPSLIAYGRELAAQAIEERRLNYELHLSPGTRMILKGAADVARGTSGQESGDE